MCCTVSPAKIRVCKQYAKLLTSLETRRTGITYASINYGWIKRSGVKMRENNMSKELDLAKRLVELLSNKEEKRGVKIELSELEVGDIFETNKRKYVVLEQVDGIGTKIMSLDFILEDEMFDDTEIDYKKSQLKKKCEIEILKDFEKEFGAENIVEHEVDLTTVDNQKCFGTVDCKVRPLTFDEARKYNEILVRSELPDWYWTCTAWSTADRGWKKSIAVVCPSGNFIRNECLSGGGVRPVCILKSNIFVSKVEE